MTTKTAIIVGNGTTRKSIDLEKFRSETKFPFFSCNAFYRDHPWVDHLIAIDDKIIAEILDSGFPRERLVIPPLNEQFEPTEYTPMRRRENAGMIAMREAIKRGYNVLGCFGFDFILLDEKQALSNVYAGTNGYDGETTATMADCLNRMKYLEWFVNKYSAVRFRFIFPKGEYAFRFIRAGNVEVQYV